MDVIDSNLLSGPLFIFIIIIIYIHVYLHIGTYK